MFMMNLPELEPRYLSIEPAPLEAEKSGRFFGRRVGGGTAIRGAELPEYLKDPDYGYAEVFGIGDEIRDFTQGWQDYAGVINAFLEDDSNYDVFEEVARSKIGDASDRNSRRVQGRMLERDFEELAIATVIRSRIRRTYPLESSQVAGNETGKGLITSTLVSVSEYNAVNAKYNGIFSNSFICTTTSFIIFFYFIYKLICIKTSFKIKRFFTNKVLM